MRVICIDDSCKNGNDHPRVNAGQIYESLGISVTGKGFVIKGIHPFWDSKGSFIVGALKERFIQLSEIDEKQLSHAEPIESTFILKEV